MIDLLSTLSSLFSRHNIIAGNNTNIDELTCQRNLGENKDDEYCYFNDYKKIGEEILFTTVEQKSLSNVNNTHSSAAFLRSGSSSSIAFVLLSE